jgi:hypothetical protein
LPADSEHVADLAPTGLGGKANVQLEVVTIDTYTTVHTLYRQQRVGARATTGRTKARKLRADADV